MHGDLTPGATYEGAGKAHRNRRGMVTLQRPRILYYLVNEKKKQKGMTGKPFSEECMGEKFQKET